MESQENDPKTVAALIARSMDNNFKVAKSQEKYYKTFLHQASVFSKRVPQNIFVVCGDAILDVLAPRLEDHCGRAFAMVGNESAFAAAHKFLRRFIDVVTKGEPEKWVAFVDTNPAFTIYTRMALCAADQLVVPCNPDEFSVNAIRSLTQLLYGAKLQAPYQMNTFYAEAQRHKLKIPRLRLVIANRFVSKEHKSGPRLYQGAPRYGNSRHALI
jgi:chromosome partitioning protein